MTAFSAAAQSGTEGNVYSVLVQPNGEVVIGGTFYNIAGGPSFANVLRYNGSTLDGSFNGPGGLGFVTALGYITNSGTPNLVMGCQYGIIRTDLSGAVQSLPSNNNTWNTTFATQMNTYALYADADQIVGVGYQGSANTYYFGSDGITVGAGAPVPGFARLDAGNGFAAVDLGFNTNHDTGATYVGVLPFQNEFLLLDGFGNLTARDIHGFRDSGFSFPPTLFSGQTLGQQNFDNAFTPAPGASRILVAGNSYYDGTNTVLGVYRMTTTGLLDTTFYPPSTDSGNAVIYAVAGQSDGKVIVGGHSLFHSSPFSANIVRLNVDGSLDTSFRPNITYTVSAMTIVSNYLYVAANSSGALPGSINGFNSWFVQKIDLGAPQYPVAPSITGDPQPVTRYAGATVTFSVSASGVPAPTYQWYNPAGLPIAGANSSTLTLANITPAQAGSYYAIARNSLGQAPSAAALLTVLPIPSGLVPIHQFGSVANDGNGTSSVLVEGPDHRLYGTATAGGSRNHGSIFSVNLDGSNFRVLYSFKNQSDGAVPYLGLVMDSSGTLYGGTSQGGANQGSGVIFNLDGDGGLNPIYTFSQDNNGNSDGSDVEALLLGADGMLYGATGGGGTNDSGTIFSVSTNGNNFTVLHTFGSIPNDGAVVYANMVQGSDGTLYGVTTQGGTNGNGTVFRIQPDGSQYTMLHNFSNDDGDDPVGIVLGRDGRLYGATYDGGQSGVGVVFVLDTNGGNFTLLHQFNGTNDGGSPYASVVLALDNRLYGATSTGGPDGNGTVFSLAPDGLDFRQLASFGVADPDGSNPVGFYATQFMQASDFNLYNAGASGGQFNQGTLFRLAAPALPDFQFNADALHLTLSWPTTASNYVLETATNLSGPWSAVTNGVSVIGRTYSITNALNNPAAFFRLHGSH